MIEFGPHRDKYQNCLPKLERRSLREGEARQLLRAEMVPGFAARIFPRLRRRTAMGGTLMQARMPLEGRVGQPTIGLCD